MYTRPNPEFVSWLTRRGFYSSVKSDCEFYRHVGNTYQRVWVHKNGGQAEIWECATDNTLGKKISRLESWKTIEELQSYLEPGSGRFNDKEPWKVVNETS